MVVVRELRVSEYYTTTTTTSSCVAAQRLSPPGGEVKHRAKTQRHAFTTPEGRVEWQVSPCLPPGR
ncbi:hypothetical protein E2C01_097006 [Portunus trituberculatus]|uniref:Uncharacterized protein n=1 Tax=Portunus trituberculatus TaxID=210409 RepID=A0A5B7K4J1_PORTR|nr:hypothetical protein [Portunus trituberculatus]